MALNRTIYFPNPTKSRTFGLSDTVRSDAYVYANIYTVLGTETLSIRDIAFTIYGSNGSGVTNQAMVILDISGKEIVLYNDNAIPAAGVFNVSRSFSDLELGPITLATGDTIKVKFVYPLALGAYTASIKTTLLVDDYTA